MSHVSMLVTKAEWLNSPHLGLGLTWEVCRSTTQATRQRSISNDGNIDHPRFSCPHFHDLNSKLLNFTARYAIQPLFRENIKSPK